MPRRLLEILFIAARLFTGGLFIYASLDKIINAQAFAEIIYYYQILPTQVVNVIALALPWLELATGLLLLFGRLVVPSSFILTALLIIFTSAIGFNLARGLDFQCGCFAISDQAHNENLMTLIRDILFLVPALFCLIYALAVKDKAFEPAGSDE